MKKADRAKLTRQMLNALSAEHAEGGFSEYSQFAEQTLNQILEHLDEVGLNYILDQVEASSYLGLNRRSKKKLSEFESETIHPL